MWKSWVVVSTSILRHAQDREFTILPNATIRDQRLSFRATGLLAYLVSLPDGTGVDSLSLSRRKKEGRDAVRTAFDELMAVGYVRRYKEQDPDTGFWRTVIEVTDQTEPTPDFQASVNQSPVSRASGFQALSQERKDRGESTEESTSSLPDGSFNDFWERYPKRHGRRVGKASAAAKWSRLSAEHRAEALVAVLVYADAVVRSETIAKDPQRFLMNYYWQDWLAAADKAGPAHGGITQCETCLDKGWVFPDGSTEASPCPACRKQGAA